MWHKPAQSVMYSIESKVLGSGVQLSDGGIEVGKLTGDPGKPTSPVFPDLPASPCVRT